MFGRFVVARQNRNACRKMGAERSTDQTLRNQLLEIAVRTFQKNHNNCFASFSRYNVYGSINFRRGRCGHRPGAW